jgi:uncharacterized protein YqeY
MKAAMKAGEPLKVSVIRMLKSEIKNTEIANGKPLTDEEVIGVVARESKRRRESIEQFARAGRTDLVDKEKAELDILSGYLPKQLDEGEVENIAQEVILDLHASSMADKGKVMSALMPRVRGKADGKAVNKIVERLLQSSSVQHG